MTRLAVTGWPQGLHLGAQLEDSHTAAQYTLGLLASDQKGNVFRYVQNILADSIAVADGTCVYFTATDGVVTPDFTGGSGVSSKVAGVGIGAIAAGSYGWVQVSGYHDAVLTDGGVAANDALVGHTVDGEADTMAAGEEHLVFGFAMATDSGSPESAPAQLTGIL